MPTERNGSRITFRFGIAFSLASSIMAGVWWASGFTQEVRTMQGSVEDNEDAVIVLRRDVFSLRERAAAGDATGKATERRLDSIDGTLRRIEEKLDRATRQGNRQ